MRPKLCYFLPIYDSNTSTHQYHIYELLEEVGKEIDIFLIIGEQRGQFSTQNIKEVYSLRHTSIPIKYFEAAWVFMKAYRKGYRFFYFHYARTFAFVLTIFKQVMGGKVLLWHCHCEPHYKMSKKKRFCNLLKAQNLKDIFSFLSMCLSLRLIDYLVTGTPRVGSFYSERFGIPKEKIRILPNWINLRRMQPGVSNNHVREQLGFGTKQVVLFVHTLSYEKGAQYIVPIAHAVRRQILDVLFIIVGDGPLMNLVKQQVIEAGLQNSILFAGRIPNTEVIHYYLAADVFIMPSDVEGFPRVLLEAMALGLPLVATDVGGVRDIITPEQEYYIVPPGDTETFAEKVVELLKDEAKRQKLSEIGLTHVKNFSLDKVASRFFAIIKDEI